MTRRLRVVLLRWLPLLLLLVCPAGAQAPDAWDAWSETRYNEARSAIEENAGDDPETLLLRVRLSRDPEEALDLARRGRIDARGDDGIHAAFAYEEASIHFARGHYLDAMAPLNEVFDAVDDEVPGALYLLAGQALRCLQDPQGAREALATVPASDPAFPWARYFLGRVALDEGDEALALRYFETASRAPLADRHPALLAGRWDALRLAGQHDEAEEVRRQLFDDYPESLAARHLSESTGAGSTDPLLAASTVDTSSVEEPGRFTVQLAAFSDRGRALTFGETWRPRLPQLRIDEEAAADGTPLYKVRNGFFASRGQARTEAERLRRSFGVESLVVESGR